MSEARRRTRTVYDVFMTLAEQGSHGVSPGDVVAYLRETSAPMAAWEVRGELSNLEQKGIVKLDEDTGVWFAVEGAEFDADGPASQAS